MSLRHFEQPSVSSEERALSSALLADFYESTMAQALRKSGRHERAVFVFCFRRRALTR